jgi:catechol 2,3-dioxygenase-like lactoylglutathione lyase family enzyme
MITGAQVTLFSTDAEADRKFFKEVLKLAFVDAGGGWLIFASPQSTCGCRQVSKDDEKPGDNEKTLIKAEYLLTVEDIEEFRKTLKNEAGIETDEPDTMAWGIVTKFTLPGGAQLQAYQPLHPMVDESSAEHINQKRTSTMPEAADVEFNASKRVKVA